MHIFIVLVGNLFFKCNWHHFDMFTTTATCWTIFRVMFNRYSHIVVYHHHTPRLLRYTCCEPKVLQQLVTLKIHFVWFQMFYNSE